MENGYRLARSDEIASSQINNKGKFVMIIHTLLFIFSIITMNLDLQILTMMLGLPLIIFMTVGGGSDRVVKVQEKGLGGKDDDK